MQQRTPLPEGERWKCRLAQATGLFAQLSFHESLISNDARSAHTKQKFAPRKSPIYLNKSKCFDISRYKVFKHAARSS
jgi:hypothetical protein